jgi:hypothetical protein
VAWVRAGKGWTPQRESAILVMASGGGVEGDTAAAIEDA